MPRTEPTSRPGTWRSALRAVLDEGVFGLSQLLVHWHLARTLDAAHYGAFSLAMLWALLAVSAHHALVVEPLLVANGGTLGRSPGYARAVLRLHWAASALAAGLVAMGGWLFSLGHAFAFEGAASGLLVLGLCSIRLARGMAYAQLPAKAGTSVVLGYASLVGLGLIALHWLQLTSGAAALLLMGGTGFAVGTVVLARQALPAATPDDRRAALAYHVQHGRWLLVVAPLRWSVDAMPLVILGWSGRLTEVALLRASLNLIAPAIQLAGVLRLMLIPRFAEARRRGALSGLVRKTQLATLLLGSAHFVAVSLGRSLLPRVYGARFAEAASLLPLLSLTPALLGSALLFGNALRVVERPDLSLGAFAGASVVGALAAVIATPEHGALGAAFALICGYTTLLLIKGWMALSVTRARQPE